MNVYDYNDVIIIIYDGSYSDDDTWFRLSLQKCVYCVYMWDCGKPRIPVYRTLNDDKINKN